MVTAAAAGPDLPRGWPEPGGSTVTAQVACVGLVTRFYELVDDGRSVEAAGLFASDAELVFNGDTVRGEALRDLLTRRDPARRTAHVSATGSFRMLGGDRAELKSFLLHYVLTDDAQSGAPTSLNAVRDILGRSAEGAWQIQRRELTRLAGVGA